MRRICLSALHLSASYLSLLSLPAAADPLGGAFSPYAASQPVYVAQQSAAVAPAPGQQYYVYVAPQNYPPPQQGYVAVAPQGYAAAPQGYYATAPQGYATAPQGYATAAQQGYATAAPAYTGTVAPHYASAGTSAQPSGAPPEAADPAAAQAAPRPLYASATPVSYAAPAAPPAPPPSSSSGGGFLEAIFGGPTIQAHVYQPQGYQPQGYQPQSYQPALPDYQSAPAPAPQGYAPSSQGDMSSYQIDPKFDRQLVDYRGEEKPGTIIIDTPNKFLYLVEDGGKALRYGIGVGRPGFTWAGVKTITAKREWPDWRPPADMLQRRPDLPRYMPGGIDNPLGARAMYLGSTLYRIHGSNEPWTIGTNVSSGCIRMRNDDVSDLYSRVKVGTKVIVI